jgi:DNA processing protein
VTGVDDIVAEIEPMIGREADAPQRIDDVDGGKAIPSAEADDVERVRILDALGPAPVEVDEIVRFTGLTPAIVHLVLLELDLGGRIARHPGGRISLVA